MFRDLIEPTNLARAVVFTVFCLVAAFPAMAALGALSNLWGKGGDSPDGVYIAVGALGIAIAILPMVFAVRLVWSAPRLVIAGSMVVAAIAVAGLVVFMDAQGKRNAERHIEERRRDSAVPPPLNPLVTPIATPSLGAPP